MVKVWNCMDVPLPMAVCFYLFLQKNRRVLLGLLLFCVIKITLPAPLCNKAQVVLDCAALSCYN